ncbi:hypothetical protein [Roseibium sp.]|uniref:hypothetical protein n=1 Tax=Roseibium sp. TaxID=1936156 RepID=UPI003A96DE2C
MITSAPSICFRRFVPCVLQWLAATVCICGISTTALSAPVKADAILLSPPLADNAGTGKVPADPGAMNADSPAPDANREDEEQPVAETQVATPEVLYDVDQLPKPVARMRAQLREAALSGDMERLRMVLEGNELMPTLSLTKIDDPIQFLRDSSGDGDGLEILAILADTLDAGFVHVDQGTAQEMFVWPYFARYPLHQLSPEQKVELYRLVTAGDFAEMESYGVWLFYRIGIGPDGTMHYFVAGE